ncbi:MAG TPA: aminodeoxychorismate synthase component I [Pyrinomonadaceae bacterium]|nr:aminodeoxychorismate synthase component I [Pyrinomonadaceae bacterium]
MRNARDPKQKLSALIVREIQLSADELLRALFSLPSHRRLSVLDSCGHGQSSANYLIAGFDPFEIIESRGNQLRISTSGDSDYVTEGDVLDLLDERLAEYRVENALPDSLPVAGACIATFSYELAHRLERLRLNSSAQYVSNEPDATLAFYDTLVVHDYRQGKTQVVGVAGSARVMEIAEAVLEAHRRAVENPEGVQPAVHAMESNFTRDEYLAKVHFIKEHIAAGDIYQANLTQQLTCALSRECRPENIFLRLRRDYPAPFAAFLRRREDVVISASPERFLRVEAINDVRQVEAWPIKGTRPRGSTTEEDDRLRAELLTSEKDRAENVMIVDLLRNDLGRVCRYGSVEVAELCSLEEHPTLFHLVSKVRGVLRDEITAGALLRATFPCGSITGAPKIRAMEIIAEAETRPRGLSMGALGYFSFTGSLDLNVAIRTMTLDDHVAVFNVGGGVVADSSPSLEYEESLLKARALLCALGIRN